MNKETGGPAFPGTWGQFNEVGGQIGSEGGMSLRDYFAAKAMQAVLIDSRNVKEVSEYAYELADAMLHERNRHENWIVHISGPDDIEPCNGELDALRKANEINKAMVNRERHEHDPIVIAIAEKQS